MKDIWKIKTSPLADEKAIVKGDCYRFTVLTSRLIRMEYAEDGNFEDRATQTVLNRNFSVPKFSVEDFGDGLKITTKYMVLTYIKGDFTEESLTAIPNRDFSSVDWPWYYGKPADGNLFGTARTLDEVDGECELEYGILSRINMYSFEDESLAMTEEGWVEPRDKNKKDIYLFAYGKEYLECLKDFYKLTGNTPMLPRFAFGNWWSRYYPYSDAEYLELMDKFKEKNIPLSVAVLDMDWHKVNIDKRYGSGWTGFSWNRELFKNPEDFLSELHKRSLKTTLNLHPADGVKGHEDMYLDMAKVMGVDYENEEKVEFDSADPKFLEAYFNYIIYPLEKMGVDFWWMDWQQGTESKIEGLDPLWMLNHLHYLDNNKDNKRGIAFSRYSGVGSHRYPIGFSGDTYMNWESLDFQPYFTATASNIGYGWWSHDIGGHMRGYRDDELTARWVQYGVFSPIMRLHCAIDIIMGKEPWNYCLETEKTMTDFMRLRHQLIPYLYSMNYKASNEAEPLCQPLYYKNAYCDEAYDYKNEYYFGSELLVVPITKKADTVTNMGNVVAWLPEGEWFDIFTGIRYTGNRRYKMYRDIFSMPVFAKAGAIIPMTENDGDINNTDNPKTLKVLVYPGASNIFNLYEDDGTRTDDFAVTKFSWNWCENPVLEIDAPQDKSCIPTDREYIIGFKKFADADISITSNGVAVDFEKSYKNETLTVKVKACPNIKIEIVNAKVTENDYKKILFERLGRMQADNIPARKLYKQIETSEDIGGLYQYLEAIDIDENVKSAVREILATI